MDEKKILTHLIKAGRDALHLERTLKQLGYSDTPYFDLYGEICEAVYCLIGEDTQTFDESLTHAAMNDIYSSDEMCAETLAAICKDSITSSGLNIPETTRSILESAAKERGVDLHKMVQLILCEWAAKEVMIHAMFK